MVLRSDYETRTNFNDWAPVEYGASGRWRRPGNGLAQRLRNAAGAPVALMKLIRVARVVHSMQSDIVMHVPVSHQRPAPEQVDLGLVGGGRYQRHHALGSFSLVV